MKRKVHKRKVLKKWVRINIFLMLLFSLGFALYLIYIGITPRKSDGYELFKYGINNKIDYSVYLTDSALDEEKVKGMNKMYFTSDIDYIDTNFNFNFSGSRESKINYNYIITGNLIIEYGETTEYGKQVIYTKSYKLSEPKSGTYTNASSFGIGDNVKINYNEYNDIITEYKKEKRLAVTARFEVTMDIDLTGTIDENTPYSYKDKMTVKIPLSETAMMITTDYKEDQEDSIMSEVVIIDSRIQIVPIIIGGVAGLSSLILLIYLCPTVIFVSVKSKYRKDLDKILKDFSEIIVTVSAPIEVDEVTFIDVKEFDDMIDIEEEYKSPILFYEVTHGKESWFVIIKDKFMYRYILKAE